MCNCKLATGRPRVCVAPCWLFLSVPQVPASSLHIVMRGVAAKAGSILTQGAHWGEDMIVSAVTLRDLRHASALSYLEVATLERDDLYDCLTSYPVSRQQVREAAMKIALQRAVLVIS
jgi:hypothetical protein